MKIFYLIIISFVLYSCNSKKKTAMEYYKQSSMMFHSIDSLENMIKLIDKAIALDPTNEHFYLTKGQLYNNYGMIDSAINTLYIYKKYNRTNYMATMGIGIFYDMKNEKDSAYKYYNAAMKEYNSRNLDTTDIYVLLDKKQLELFLYDSTNFDDLQYLINSHKDSALLNFSIETLKNKNRQELIEEMRKDMQIKNIDNHRDSLK